MFKSTRFVIYPALMLAICCSLPCESQNIPTTRDPRINGTINPKINGTINPKINGTINPKINRRIDPKITLRLRGEFVFGLDEDRMGILIWANKTTLLWFDPNLNWKAYAVSNRDNGFNLFDLDGEWIGYLVDNGNGDFNLFDTDGEWCGFTT